MNVSHAPNAALLIDFDNVTMAIRSDLGKELKALLNSEVIRGKVSVQRAYADWRRYPQYIVPLAESSIDLIFAPAYGSAKKNATDLRMAIDAIELVFTRPEIGTYILLTGDSDFSSCVLKLKEYGKYVIGVGMRESSSDLLIQNCDEYYSYHALSGLTRADEVIESKEDPWQLVRRATQHMVANQDVMRTDRLKQVMLTMDPAFDEKKLGYTKFSRFVQEAATKGLLQLKKMENGQLEIVVDGTPPVAAPERERERSESPRSRRGENGRRGRRGTSDAPRERPTPTAPAPAPITISDEAEAGVAAPVEAAPAAAPLGAPTEPHSAYALLQQALGALAGRDGKWVRDGDVKRRMLEISPEFDEGKFGFPKFSRFLRQAHDAEIIDLNRVGTGHYEVALSGRAPRLAPPAPPEAPARAPAATTAAAAAPTAPTPAPREMAAATPAAEMPRQLGALRGRRGARGAPAEGPPPLLPGQVIRPPSTAALEPEAPEATPEIAEPVAELAVSEAPTAEAPAMEAPAAEAPAAPARRGRGRRGSRGRAAPEAPPEILPGQIVEAPSATPAEEAAPTPEPETEAQVEAPAKQRRRSRTRKARAEAPAETQAEAPAPEPAPEPAFSAADLGLPGDPDSITDYLSNSYRGIGKKTAEALLDAFGTDLFQVMQEEPDRVRAALGDRRASTLLEQWPADYERRMQEASAAEEAPAPPQVEAAAEPEEETPDAEQDADGTPRGRSRSRRGGRGRTRKKREEPAST
ncbi:hypothetical protein BH23GEM7_BH23GEM7_30030 [soil metagenome]